MTIKKTKEKEKEFKRIKDYRRTYYKLQYRWPNQLAKGYYDSEVTGISIKECLENFEIRKHIYGKVDIRIVQVNIRVIEDAIMSSKIIEYNNDKKK